MVFAQVCFCLLLSGFVYVTKEECGVWLFIYFCVERRAQYTVILKRGARHFNVCSAGRSNANCCVNHDLAEGTIL
jgi:hypothetical protein